VHWDDIHLLRTIDRLEQTETGSLSNGLWLMQKEAEGQPLDHNRDYRTFVWELVLAGHAGYLGWDDRGVSAYRPDPLSDPNAWLQEIRDIRLTLAGRDRARGRLVIRPLPEPDEDDDRLITGMTLEEIARDIGDTFTSSQLPRFLRDSGLPEDHLTPVDGNDNWAYVLDVFERLHNGGSAARRSLRGFIAAWLEDKLHAGPSPDVRRRIVAQLARQGWFVKDSRLVIGEPQVGEIPPLSPVGREARIAALHPLVRQAAHRYIDSNHMGAAILEAFKAVSLRMKELTGLDTDGADLVGKALGGTSPMLQIADQSTQTGRDIQAGYQHLFRGAVTGIRNPNAHELFQPLDDNDALEQLSLASLLMHRLDAAKSVPV
jgi:uncharacterized protein (TIGR02391 family)